MYLSLYFVSTKRSLLSPTVLNSTSALTCSPRNFFLPFSTAKGRHKVQTAPNNTFWTDLTNRKHCVENLALKLGFNRPEDWYKVKVSDFQEHNGEGLIEHYDLSPSSLLKSVYPDREWFPWKFTQVPRGYWKDNNNSKEYLHHLAATLGFNKLEDWYKVKFSDFKENDGVGDQWEPASYIYEDNGRSRAMQ